MDLQYHPLFERWLEELAEEDEEIFGEVMGLLTALELYGRVLGDEQREESHAVVTSRLPKPLPTPIRPQFFEFSTRSVEQARAPK